MFFKRQPIDVELMKNQHYLQHKKEMAIIIILGTVAILGTGSVGATLLCMVWWSLSNEMKDIAIVIGLAGTILGAVTTVFAYLVPSPLQSVQNRRAQDFSGGGSGPNINAETIENVNAPASPEPQVDLPSTNDQAEKNMGEEQNGER